MSMDFYLSRPEQAKLCDKLHDVPALVEDLSITITRQAHIEKSGLGNIRRPQPESRVPFHIGAARAADELHNCLTTWVRFTCEHRRIRYTDHGDTTTLARWLRRNVIPLALTPGSEESADDIIARIDACRECVDLPPDDLIMINPTQVQAANRSVVTLATIATIAGRLGDIGKGLNRDRLRLLAKHGDVKSVGEDTDTGTKFYRLGDVLHAHHAHRRRGQA